LGYGRRERMNTRNDMKKKLNLFKVFGVLATFVLVIVAIVLVVNTIKDAKGNKIEAKENELIQAVKDNAEVVNEFKTIDDMLDEFGGEIETQVNSDTYYIKKDGKTYTAYTNDVIVEGKIVPWTGEQTQPPVDEAGNINIYTAEELKWIANQVINGEKNFSGVTITLRQDIDLGARKKEDGTWEGKQWTPIIGFLDELPKKEEVETQNQIQENTVIDETVEVINENLKRFAGVFNGDGHSIRGLYINTDKRYQGLFGISTGTIQNLEIKNSYLNGGEGTGAIVGLNGGKILNSRITNTEVKGKDKVGGIAGVCMTSAWLQNCFSNETSVISGRDYVGGLAGYVNNNSAIIQCENEAIVSGKNYIGGNVGIIFYGSMVKDVSNRSNCILGEKYIGGIAGHSAAQLENCLSMNLDDTGYIKGKEYVGGIVGLNYVMGDITSCVNKSKIIIEENNGGGIAGLNNSSISNCYNNGNIDASSCDGTKIGGICGQNISESFINTSYNIGKIDFKSEANGIVGIDFGTTTKCYYLDSSIKNKDERYVKSDKQLKEEVLKEAKDFFKEDSENINSGYPILKWE